MTLSAKCLGLLRVLDDQPDSCLCNLMCMNVGSCKPAMPFKCPWPMVKGIPSLATLGSACNFVSCPPHPHLSELNRIGKTDTPCDDFAGTEAVSRERTTVAVWKMSPCDRPLASPEGLGTLFVQEISPNRVTLDSARVQRLHRMGC